MSFVYKGSKSFKCNLLCAQCQALTKTGTQCKKTTCKYLPTCYQHTKSIYHLEVKPSRIPNAGNGLFALKKFKIGEKIADYRGEVLTRQQRIARYGNTQQDVAPYAFEASKNKIIDSACQRCPASYANDRRGNPALSTNAKFYTYQGQSAGLKASRPINAGDEILVSYGPQYWNHQGSSYRTNKYKLKNIAP